MTTRQSKSIHLGLLLHNHQPVGNFPWVFQQVYEEAYLPMIEALERHPEVRLSLHYTGSLLDWMEEAQPAFLLRLALLVKRQQVEIVSGGYYEPILPSRSEEHTSELQSHLNLVCRLLLEKKKKYNIPTPLYKHSRQHVHDHILYKVHS